MNPRLPENLVWARCENTFCSHTLWWCYVLRLGTFADRNPYYRYCYMLAERPVSCKPLDSFFTPSDWTRHDCMARVHQKMVNSCRRARYSSYITCTMLIKFYWL